jgi:hypothetical protein
MKPYPFKQIIDRKQYNTSTATLLAGNDWWDGNNWERGGTNQFLYRTPKGAYFTLNLTQWEGRNDCIEVVSLDEAIELYEGPLRKHRVEYDEAFPGVTVEEA